MWVDGEASRPRPACVLSSTWLTAVAAFVAAAVVVVAAACSTPREEARRAAQPDGRSCGSYVVPQAGFEPAEVRAQQECVVEAFATGDPRSLTYRHPTDEGDPIEVTLTVVEEGVVEVRTDATADGDGFGGVRIDRCRNLALVRGHLKVGDCVVASSVGS